MLEILQCPVCKHDQLDLKELQSHGEIIESGSLLCSKCKHEYPIVSGIPRFVNKIVSTFDQQVKKRFETQWKTWGSNEVIFGRTKSAWGNEVQFGPLNVSK